MNQQGGPILAVTNQALLSQSLLHPLKLLGGMQDLDIEGMQLCELLRRYCEVAQCREQTTAGSFSPLGRHTGTRNSVR